ncbi:JAB domain-containing protein [Pelobium sp.]|nr:JAB domain-containing protein [Pelobium sp.]MDA9554641.1 JAB domain-containing protein [Pelobium sp.]
MEKFQKQTSNELKTENAQISLFQVSEISVTYKPKFKASERPRVTSSKQVYDIFNKHWDADIIELKEQFKIMLLNRANRVIGIYEVSNGGMSGTIADPKLIFSTALKTCASSIILSHNHPSGNLKPSEADKTMTRKIKAGGELLDITVLDHVIITAEGYFSFADEGLL